MEYHKFFEIEITVSDQPNLIFYLNSYCSDFYILFND